MAAAPREFKIEYDTPAAVTAGSGFTVGDTTARQIPSKDGPIRIERSWDSFSLEFSFVIVKDTAANFKTEVDTVEEALRTPYNRLRVTMAGQVQYDFDPSTASGFDIMPTITKAGDPTTDSALSRSYRVRFEVGLPADLRGSSDGAMGLRSSTVDVSYTPARRRTVTITGVYTGVTAEVDARTQYEAQIDTYANAVLAAIDSSAEFELTEEPRSEIEDTDLSGIGMGRVINFSRIFKEIIYSQAGSSNDNTNIVDQEFRITRRREAPGDSVIGGYKPLRLVIADISYSAWIDKEKTQDLKGEWADTIRAWVISQTKDTLAKYIKGGIAIVAEAVTFEWDDNRISATMTAQALAKASMIVERRYTSDVAINPGVVLVPVWSGDQFAKYKYNGPATKTVTVTDILRVEGGQAPPPNMAEAPPGFEGAVLISSREAKTPLTMGMDADNQISVDEYSASNVFEVYTDPGGPSPTGTTGGRGGTFVPGGIGDPNRNR